MPPRELTSLAQALTVWNAPVLGRPVPVAFEMLPMMRSDFAWLGAFDGAALAAPAAPRTSATMAIGATNRVISVVRSIGIPPSVSARRMYRHFVRIRLRRDQLPHGATRDFATPSDVGGGGVLLRRPHLRALPLGDVLPHLGAGHPVVVDDGPVRVVELVQGEARLQRVVEAHVVDRLVHRLLDQQRGHRRDLRDASRELERALRQLVLREDLAHHAELVALLYV